MNEADRPLPSVVLAIVAHPDDIDFGMGGTMAVLAGQGVEIIYCLVTDGDAGGEDRSVARHRMAAIRRDEQRAAANIVGAKEVLFLGYPDGLVEPTVALRRDLSRVIRQVRPDRVMTQSPIRNLERVFASHPDHLAVGEATLSAVYPDARNAFAFPELLASGLETHAVPEVWISGGPNSDVFIDITDTFPAKLAALDAHASQTGHRDPASFEKMLRGWGELVASLGNLPAGRLAEAYRRVETT